MHTQFKIKLKISNVRANNFQFQIEKMSTSIKNCRVVLTRLENNENLSGKPDSKVTKINKQLPRFTLKQLLNIKNSIEKYKRPNVKTSNNRFNNSATHSQKGRAKSSKTSKKSKTLVNTLAIDHFLQGKIKHFIITY